MIPLCLPPSIVSRVRWKGIGARVGRGTFNIPKSILDLIYTQCILWLGFIFCPLLPIIILITTIMLFYVKKVPPLLPPPSPLLTHPLPTSLSLSSDTLSPPPSTLLTHSLPSSLLPLPSSHTHSPPPSPSPSYLSSYHCPFRNAAYIFYLTLLPLQFSLVFNLTADQQTTHRAARTNFIFLFLMFMALFGILIPIAAVVAR